jgi:hypothetical protein
MGDENMLRHLRQIINQFSGLYRKFDSHSAGQESGQVHMYGASRIHDNVVHRPTTESHPYPSEASAHSHMTTIRYRARLFISAFGLESPK